MGGGGEGGGGGGASCEKVDGLGLAALMARPSCAATLMAKAAFPDCTAEANAALPSASVWLM